MRLEELKEPCCCFVVNPYLARIGRRLLTLERLPGASTRLAELWRSKVAAFFIGIMAALLVSANAAAVDPQDDMAVRYDIANRCSRLLLDRDFIGLSRQLDAYQFKDVRTAAGGWKLEACFDNVLWQAPPSRKDGGATFWSDLENALSSYMRAHPSDRNIPIVYAHVLEKHAWAYRGSGFASTVKEESWAPFHNYMMRSRRALDKTKSLSSSNPMWYVERIVVLKADASDTVDFFTLLDEASRRYPGFTTIYLAAAEYLQPKWHGSLKEIEWLADHAATLAKATEGESLYAEVYAHAAGLPCCVDDEVLQKSDLNRERLERAIDELVERFPNQWNYNNYAHMACLAKDFKEARKLITHISPDFISAAWEAGSSDAKKTYLECKRRAEESTLAP